MTLDNKHATTNASAGTPQPAVYYTIKKEDRLFYALALETPKARSADRWGGYYNTRELHQNMRENFGPTVQYLSNAEFETELAKRQLHSIDVLSLLIIHGELLGKDLSRCIVYGSPMRPMDGLWASIPDAVYIPSDWNVTRYHTYIAVPTEINDEKIRKYELAFVSRPAPQEALGTLEQCLSVEVIRVSWQSEAMKASSHFYYHPGCYTGSNLPKQQIETRTIQEITNRSLCCGCWGQLQEASKS